MVVYLLGQYVITLKPNKMQIQVNTVEGTTGKRGAKQNKVYTIIGQGSKETVLPNGEVVDLSTFYTATDGKRNFDLWNVHEDWSSLGIRKANGSRYSFCRNFTVIN